jgi:hypothetical protein
MTDLHIILSEVEDPHALAEALAGEGDDTSPALMIEAVVRDLGEIAAEFMEYQINGTRYWLDSHND